MKIALRSMANGKLVCAEGAGHQPLIANRDAVGDWETFELITLDAPDAPVPSQPAPPASADPTPSPTVAYVAAVKHQLEARGVDLSGACGAFAITKRVAWGLRGQGAGLLSKPGGNNCNGFATDIIMFDNGNKAVDILSDGGGSNGPTWAAIDVDDGPGRFRRPEDPNA